MEPDFQKKVPEASSSNSSVATNCSVDVDELRNLYDSMSNDDLAEQFEALSKKWLYPFENIEDVIKNADSLDRKTSMDFIDFVIRNFELEVLDKKSLATGFNKCIFETTSLLFFFKKNNMLESIEPETGVIYIILFNKILEIIYYSEQFMRGFLRVKLAMDPEYDTAMLDDISLFRFSPIDYSKNTAYQNLLLYLLGRLFEKGYRRYRDCCYEKIFNDKGYFTYSWREAMTIEKFVYKNTQKEIHFEQWHNATSDSGNINRSIKHLSNCYDREFRELKKDRHIFSFRNGVYIAKNRDPRDGSYYDRFYKYGTQPSLPSNIVACKYFDKEFDNFSKIKDWHDIPTPNLQKIIDYQFSKYSDHSEISKWMYIMMGRLIYETNECDGWQIFPYFQGIAGTGKGTILKVLTWFYDPDDVAALENSTEKIFGLESIHDKYIFIAAELKKNLNIDQATFQKIVSGEEVSVAIKNKTAKKVIWKVPGAAAGNTTIFQDNSGSISRRFVTFTFKRKVSKKIGDPKLEEKLMEELPAIIKKCNAAYLWAVNKYSDQDVWNVLPGYFQTTRDEISQETNVIKNFMSSGKLEFGKDLACQEKDFKLAFNQHCNENNLGRHQIGPSIYDEPFSEFSEIHGIVIEQKKLKGVEVIGGKRFKGTIITGVAIKEPEFEFEEPEGVEGRAEGTGASSVEDKFKKGIFAFDDTGENNEDVESPKGGGDGGKGKQKVEEILFDL